MAGGVLHHAGGTLSLVKLLEEHSEAVEYELICRGLRLRHVGSMEFNWRDLWVIIKGLPEDSALHRAITVIDEDSIWTPEMMLLAEVHDLVAYLVWFQTKDGQANRNRPKPFARPGYRQKKEEYAPLPADEMLDWLGWTAPDDIGELEAVMQAEEQAEATRSRSKLTEDDVRAIRAATGLSQTQLAARHCVSRSTIAAVRARRTWQHIN